MTVTTSLQPFDFDVEQARSQFERERWFHAKGGASEALMSAITAQVASLIGSSDRELASWRYPDKKEQYLWDLPSGLEVDELCRHVAEVTGMDPARTVVSERHLKVYSATAPAMPPPHKDRSASTVTVGVGIDIPAESRLVLWPDVDRTYNPYPTAAEWRDTRTPDELPEVVTADVPPTEIDMRRGDVVMFAGAEFYHERYQPAKTTVLYLKFNDRGLDPLGEDPRTMAAEERSRQLESSGIAPGTVLTVSPRVIGVRHDNYFPDLGSVASVLMFGDGAGTVVSEQEAEVLRSLSSNGPTIAAELGANGSELSRLLRLGFVLIS